jgi:hypothetical protein
MDGYDKVQTKPSESSRDRRRNWQPFLGVRCSSPVKSVRSRFFAVMDLRRRNSQKNPSKTAYSQTRCRREIEIKYADRFSWCPVPPPPTHHPNHNPPQNPFIGILESSFVEVSSRSTLFVRLVEEGNVEQKRGTWRFETSR